jgi:hypothetical protein
MASEPERWLTPEIAAKMSRLAGLSLSLERAAELLPLLQGIYKGDAKIRALELGNTPAVGPTWAGAGDA